MYTYIYIQGDDDFLYATSDMSTARQLNSVKDDYSVWRVSNNPVVERVFFEEISSALGAGAAVSSILVLYFK